MATIESLEIPTGEMVLNRTSIQDLREDNRKSQYNEAKAEFIENVMRIFHAHATYVMYI